MERERHDVPGLVKLAHALADAAGEAILPHFRSDALATSSKSSRHFDPVTVADRAAERAMRDMLAAERPRDGILGEEFGAVDGESGLTWILDPIDGTRGFLSGTPTWGVLIALADADGPFLGVVDQPFTRERFTGAPGLAEAKWAGGRRELRTRPARAIGETILFTTFPEIGTEQEAAAFARVAREVRLVRYGMDCYAYALLALGQIDLVIEAGLEPYDIAAPLALVEAAGGVVTDWKGASAASGGQVLAAANDAIHADALPLLSAR